MTELLFMYLVCRHAQLERNIQLQQKETLPIVGLCFYTSVFAWLYLMYLHFNQY